MYYTYLHICRIHTKIIANTSTNRAVTLTSLTSVGVWQKTMAGEYFAKISMHLVTTDVFFH